MRPHDVHSPLLPTGWQCAPILTILPATLLLISARGIKGELTLGYRGMDWLFKFPQLNPDILLTVKRTIDGSLRALTRVYGDSIENFFYPLQRDHYGPAENSLVEAMSLGLTPLVLNNPPEMAIVRDAETGFVAASIEEIGSLLQTLLLLPDVQEKISRNAIRHVAETRTPALSAQDFMIQWLGLLGEPARRCDFRSAIGETPAEWFLSTQCLPGAPWISSGRPGLATPLTDTLAHFERAFAGDESFSRLRKLSA